MVVSKMLLMKDAVLYRNDCSQDSRNSHIALFLYSRAYCHDLPLCTSPSLVPDSYKLHHAMAL
ncbi:hypothetical protein H5410_018861 [Solanum commersonii]|uniref:Uncharacterized protein n=1 Tax=Solanum commersonii TaxID=4109 RepID=A0A9J6A396_SOLCO|nr:hypothetical protein H5410_018861 [Solanum commersonii]